jgi:hypothetical protein
MLDSRKIIATLAGETLEGSVAKGCLQGGILSPLLWSLVLDELIGGCNKNGCSTLGYADDIAILISRKYFQTPSQSFFRRLWVQYNSGVIELNCLSIHKRW